MIESVNCGLFSHNHSVRSSWGRSESFGFAHIAGFLQFYGIGDVEADPHSKLYRKFTVRLLTSTALVDIRGSHLWHANCAIAQAGMINR